MIQPVKDRRTPITPQLALRVAIFGAIAFALFAIVFFRLWYLQVLSGDKYLQEANNNRVRSLRIPAPRGRIVDRNGVTLVKNQRAVVVQLDPSKLPNAERTLALNWGAAVTRRVHRPKGKQGNPIPIPPIATPKLHDLYARLAKVLTTPNDKVTALSIHHQVVRSLVLVPYSSVTLKTAVPRAVLGYLTERQQQFPGVTVAQVYLRTYPHGQIGAQVLGTVGQIKPDQLHQSRYRGVPAGTVVGQNGIEKTYDRYLRGQDGVQRVQVDASGRPIANSHLHSTDPAAGQRVKLSVDYKLEKAGQDALQGPLNPGGQPGALVALDPRDGSVIAMASNPTYDPSVLAKPITPKRFAQLFGDASAAPLVNRAIAGRYPTGSTFKPITAMAGLQSGTISPDKVVVDDGCIKIGRNKQEYCNAKKEVNGPVAMREALEVSSDIYFYELGLALFSKPKQVLQHWARQFGLGAPTGIDIPDEVSGLIPDEAWRLRLNAAEVKCRAEPKQHGRPCFTLEMRDFQGGDEVNLAVGQGDLQATPLQMAVAYSALVNGGRVVQPHLGQEIEDSSGRPLQHIDRTPARRIKFDPANRQVIMDGLKLAAEGPRGTSTDVFSDWPNDRLPIYGKTGTAERCPNHSCPDQSWYIAYVDSPTRPIVIALTVEKGGFGAATAAPMVRQMLDEYYGVAAKKIVKGTDQSN